MVGSPPGSIRLPSIYVPPSNSVGKRNRGGFGAYGVRVGQRREIEKERRTVGASHGFYANAHGGAMDRSPPLFG